MAEDWSNMYWDKTTGCWHSTPPFDPRQMMTKKKQEKVNKKVCEYTV